MFYISIIYQCIFVLKIIWKDFPECLIKKHKIIISGLMNHEFSYCDHDKGRLLTNDADE